MTRQQLQNLQKKLWSHGGGIDSPNDLSVLASVFLSLSPESGFQVARPLTGMPAAGDVLPRGMSAITPLDTPVPVHHDILHSKAHLDRRAPLMVDKSVEAVNDLVEDRDLSTSVFHKETISLLAGEVQKSVWVPGVPPMVINFLMSKIVEVMADKMSFETTVELNSMLSGGYSAGSDVKATKFEIDALAEKISAEIGPEINVPMVSEEDEEKAIKSILVSILSRRAISGAQKRRDTVKFIIKGGKAVLHEEGRNELVKELNEKVDVPFMNEEAEQKMLKKAVDSTAKLIEDNVPPSLLQIMDGLELEDSKGYAEMRDTISERLEKVDLPGGFDLVPEPAKKWVIGKVVDALLESTIGDTQNEMATLTSEGRLAKLKRRREMCEQSLKVNEVRYQQEQDKLRKRIANIDKRIEAEAENSS